jgi:DNA-directed RNA polymerase specialized sigma24 family protein
MSIGIGFRAPLEELERSCYECDQKINEIDGHQGFVPESAIAGDRAMSDTLFDDLEGTLGTSDEKTFEKIYSEVLPKVIEAARRKFGERIRWYTPEDAASSAVRTVYRRLKEQKLEDLKTWKDFENLLVTVAYRKYVDRSRRAVIESRARERIALDPFAPDESQSQALDLLAAEESKAEALEVLELLNAVPHDDVECLVLRGKLDGDSEQTIADLLAAKTGEPWSKYMIRRIWEKIRMQFLQRAAIRFPCLED